MKNHAWIKCFLFLVRQTPVKKQDGIIMRLDQNPVFRKVIVSWYDTEKACGIMIFFMVCVLLFGIGGILVCRENSAYHAYLWVPILLIVLSAGVIISTAIRMTKRRRAQFSK